MRVCLSSQKKSQVNKANMHLVVLPRQQHTRIVKDLLKLVVLCLRRESKANSLNCQAVFCNNRKCREDKGRRAGLSFYIHEEMRTQSTTRHRANAITIQQTKTRAYPAGHCAFGFTHGPPFGPLKPALHTHCVIVMLAVAVVFEWTGQALHAELL